MKCIYCGAWTEVLETRKGRRRRKCGNSHLFHTQESPLLDLTYRDNQIARWVEEGQQPEAVARSFNLSLEEVNEVLARPNTKIGK